MPEHGVHGCHRDAILGCILNLRKWQDRDVSEIGEQIQNHDDPAACKQRAHKVARRVAHFAPDERHVRPRRLRKERADHRFAKKKRQCEAANESKTGLRDLRAPAVDPRIPRRG